MKLKLKINNRRLLIGFVLTILLTVVTITYFQQNTFAANVDFGSAYQNGDCRIFGTPQTASIPDAQEDSFDDGDGIEASVNGLDSTIYKSNDIYHCCYEQLLAGETPAACEALPTDVVSRINNPDKENPWYVSSNGNVHYDWGFVGQSLADSGYYNNNQNENANSEFTYSTELPGFGVSGLSANDYVLYDYQARVTDPPPLSGFENWYEYLRRLVPVNTNDFSTFTAGSLSGNISSGLGGTDGVFIKDGGDLSIAANSTCNGRMLVMVEGNLTIDPPFRLANRNIAQEQGCIFIVGGDVIINDTGGEQTIKQGAPAAELLEAGIISGQNVIFEHNRGNSLYIRGFVSGLGGEFMRDNNEGDQPSIHTDYDPRYVELFQNELRLLRFSTREKGYTTPEF